jgi:coiled-coil domain-containing protein 61
MSEENCLNANLQVKSINYQINLTIVAKKNERLDIELKQSDTADIWTGSFESTYVEELTKKTGNFKSFPIFVNMLKTAIKQDSNSVSLDILTITDLERLRSKKAAHGNTTSNRFNNNSDSNNCATNINKRFLILTYNVEFDRINYPLQLNYQGKADMSMLLETINTLKAKISSFENEVSFEPFSQQEMNKLKQENESLKRQNGSLLIENEHLKEEIQQESFFEEKKESNQKETKLLKQMIRTIEEKNLKEKNLLNKRLQQKMKENDHLRSQLEKLKINERHLQSEIRSLTSQLRMNRNRNTSSLIHHQRSSSLESLRQRSSSSIGSFQPASHKQSRAINYLEQNRLNIRNRSTSSAYSRKSSYLSPSHSIESLNSYTSIKSNDSTRNRANAYSDTVKKRNEKLNTSGQKRTQSGSRGSHRNVINSSSMLHFFLLHLIRFF